MQSVIDSALGSIFGFEIGVVAGTTDAPETDAIAKSVNSANEVPFLPHGGLMLQCTIPFGLSAEVVIIPETELDDLSVSVLTFAGKWTLTESFIKLPLIDIAGRFHYSSAEASYKTTTSVSSVPLDSKVTIDSSSWGVSLSAGLNLVFVKPYVGLGYVSSQTDMGVNASTGTIFDSSFTTSTTASKEHSGTHYFVGTEIDLFVIHLGIEYSNIYGVDKYTGKFSLAF